MLGLFNNNKDNLRIEVKNNPLVNLVIVFIFVGIAMVLSIRSLGIATDDQNYLNYFYYATQVKADNLLVYLIEEPLWRLYTTSVVLVLSPEDALRLTIFISSTLFLFSTNKVNSNLFLIVAIAFILHQYLATQMYFNQLRQGLALSLFLCFATYGKKPLLGAILAIFVHTSFIFPLILIVLLKKVTSIKWIVLCSVLIIMGLYMSISLLETLDLGRRTSSYSFEGKFTVNYYIYTFVRYVPLLFLIQFYGYETKSSFWYKLALSSFIIIIPFTLIYDAAGRLVYYLSAFFLLMLLEQAKSLGGKLGLIYYFMFLFVDLLFLESSVINNWQLILGI